MMAASVFSYFSFPEGAGKFFERFGVADVDELSGGLFGEGLDGHFGAVIGAIDDFERVIGGDVESRHLVGDDVEIDFVAIASRGIGAESVCLIGDPRREVAEIGDLRECEGVTVVLSNGTATRDGFADFEGIVKCRSGEFYDFVHDFLQIKPEYGETSIIKNAAFLIILGCSPKKNGILSR